MTTLDLSDLIVEETNATVYAKLLAFAAALGLQTETWHPGDPTRTLFDADSRLHAGRERLVVELIKAGFLDLASGDGLTLCAKYLFGVDRVPATYATCTLRFTNTGNALFAIDPEDYTLLNSDTQKTYRNSTGGTLNPNSTLDVTITAEEAGAASSAGIGEIDTLVNALPKVSVSNVTTAVGTDAESDPALRARCRAKLGSLSPNGPADAYAFVALTPELVNGRVISRVRVVDNSTVGEVQVYVAGPSGAVDAPTVADVDAGIETYANPLCNSATVTSATNAPQNITYTLWVYSGVNKQSAEIQADVQAALIEALKTRPIGGDITPPALTGYIYKGFIEATILQAVAPYGYRVTVSAPAADVSLAVNQVAVLGTLTATINVVEGP